MKLEKHIINLLYRHECVVIPAFGAFITEWQSAQIVENASGFLPPRKLVSFNQLIKTNDGLLANHVAKEENVSYETANVLINNNVVFWIEKLKNNETIQLDAIGEISENSDKNWVFKPNLQHNFLTDSFGLSSFNSPEIIRNNGYVAPVFENGVAEKSVEEFVEAKQQLVFEKTISVKKPNTTKPQPKVVSFNNAAKRRNQYLKYVASVAIIGCLSAFGYQQYGNYSFEQNQKFAVENAKKLVNKKIQEASFALPNFTESIVLQEEIKQENTSTTTDLTSATINLNLPFQVVAGSFQSMRRSNVLIAELKNLGYNTEVSHPKNGIYRVVLASFSTENEAETYKNKVAENPKYKDTWVLK